jgi:hypothetical protein
MLEKLVSVVKFCALIDCTQLQPQYKNKILLESIIKI